MLETAKQKCCRRLAFAPSLSVSDVRIWERICGLGPCDGMIPPGVVESVVVLPSSKRRRVVVANEKPDKRG
jgi:hypothetical protein